MSRICSAAHRLLLRTALSNVGMRNSPARAIEITPSIEAAAAVRGNLLLDALPSTDRRQLLASGEAVHLRSGDVLCEAGEPMDYVYFPIASFISLISSISERCSLDVGLVGAEGMLGVSLMLDVNIAPGRGVVQGAGIALRLNAAQFAGHIKRSAALEGVLKRYLYVFMSQLSQMAACSRFHLVEARLARLLLMTRDRARSDEFLLTQDEAARMLGVRRVSITVTAAGLQQRGLIRYTRGNVTILDGRGLKGLACKCYTDTRHLYSRLMRASRWPS